MIRLQVQAFIYTLNKWKLDINFKKSKVMVFGAPTQNHIHSVSMRSIGQNILENVNEYCYLGITLGLLR